MPFHPCLAAGLLESLDHPHRLFAHRKRVLGHDCINVTVPKGVHQVKVLIEGDQDDVICRPKLRSANIVPSVWVMPIDTMADSFGFARSTVSVCCSVSPRRKEPCG